MQLFHSLSEPFPATASVVLTIGNFDGVHLGHQAVLDRVVTLAKRNGMRSAAITFDNHPSEVLRPGQRLFLLSTVAHKMKLLEELGIDFLILLTFTREFSEQSAETFLRRVRHCIPFSHLILGHDAALGKGREGNPQEVQALGKVMLFQVEYLAPFSVEGERISSSLIRTAVQQGDLDRAKALLGRGYSIYSQVIRGASRGTSLGFPTLNIDVTSLCLPPLGVYAVKVIGKNSTWKGVANLGTAPTVRSDNIPLLEVHLLGAREDLYGQNVEVLFQRYIRPEKKFQTIEELQEQIRRDIVVANDTDEWR